MACEGQCLASVGGVHSAGSIVPTDKAYGGRTRHAKDKHQSMPVVHNSMGAIVTVDLHATCALWHA